MGQVSFPIVFAQFTFFKIHFVLLINEKKILLLSLNDPFEGRGRVGWVTYKLRPSYNAGVICPTELYFLCTEYSKIFTGPK